MVLGSIDVFPFLHGFRFGKALASTRTLHQKAHLKKARKFLKVAMASGNTADKRPTVNKQWSDMANLAEVMAFLSQ